MRQMNMRVFTTCLLACKLIASAGIARASDPAGMNAGTNDGTHILVLGIGHPKKNAPPDAALELDSSARSIVLGRLGELYPRAITSCAGSEVSIKDQSCRDIGCWQGIVQRCGAQRLIVGDTGDQDDIYMVRLVLVNQDGLSIKREQDSCVSCSAEDKAEKLKSVLGALLASSRSSVVAPPTVANDKPPPDPQLPACPQYYSFGRGVAIGASTYMLAAGLTASIAYSAMDGRMYFQKIESDGASLTKSYDFGAKQAIGFSLSALPLGGLVASLLANRPQGRSAHQPGVGEVAAMCQLAPPSKKTFRRGFALGTLGAAAVSGIVTTAVLAGLHGRPIDNDMRYKSTYDFVAPAAASGVVTGVSVVGFLIAWPW